MLEGASLMSSSTGMAGGLTSSLAPRPATSGQLLGGSVFPSSSGDFADGSMELSDGADPLAGGFSTFSKGSSAKSYRRPRRFVRRQGGGSSRPMVGHDGSAGAVKKAQFSALLQHLLDEPLTHTALYDGVSASMADDDQGQMWPDERRDVEQGECLEDMFYDEDEEYSREDAYIEDDDDRQYSAATFMNE